MDERPGPSMLELIGIGGTVAGCIAVGVGAGYWIGSALHAETIAIFSGLGLGTVAGGASAFVKIKKYL